MRFTFTKVSLAVTSLVLALGTVIAVPALAEDGGSSSGSGDSSSTSGSPDSSSNDPSGAGSQHEGTETETKASDIDTAKSETEFRQHGQIMVDGLRQHKHKHTAAERMQFCEAHKQGMTTKFASVSTNLDRFQTRIDTILAKVQAYQKDNNVTVANWDSLLAAAASAQTHSASSIAALKAITPSVDCNNASVAQDVATFKSGAQAARDNLKLYRDAVRALVHALLDAKSASNTTEGSTNQ